MTTETTQDDGDSEENSVDGTYAFCGLTRFNEGSIPDDVKDHGSSIRWWAANWSGSEQPTEADLPDEGLNTLIDQLPRATTATTGWQHPVTGEWVTTDKHNAVIEPSVAEQVNPNAEDAPAGDEALFNIPTDDYTIINPSDFLRPLAEVIRAEGLADDVFGEFRVSRGGGRVSADVFFDGKHVEAPSLDDDRKPIVVGLQFDWDFFGDTALKIRGMGMDWECVNSLREITDSKLIKHAGDVEERVEWESIYEELLEELDLKTDQLSQMIHEASQERLDLSELPNDFADDYDSVLEALYAYAGLPDYLAEVAANNCRAEADDPFDPDWWTIHRGATYAISHEARGEVGSGSAVDRYNRIANDMLANPAGMADQIEAEYEADHEEATLAEEGGGEVSIGTAFESVKEKREQYEEREEQIHALIES